MKEPQLETSLLSIDEQIAEAKSRAEKFHQSLRDAKLLEQTYMHQHDHEKLSLEREKLQFELERQKWSKSLAEKNSTVQQLERELSSTVNALHEAMQATHDLNNSSSSSSSVALSHSPHHKNGYHHHHDDSLHHNSVHHHHHNGNIYYDEDGRKKDDRVDGNKSHRVEHRKHTHDYSPSKHSEDRGIYGSWVPGGGQVGGSKHVVSEKHPSPHRQHHRQHEAIQHSNRHDHHSHHNHHHTKKATHHHSHHSHPTHHHPHHSHHEKPEPTIDPVIPLVQQSLHKDVAEYQKENRRLKDDMRNIEDELKILRSWKADAEGKLKFRLDQVLDCERQVLMLKSQVIHLTDLNKALVDTIEVNEKHQKEKLQREQEINLQRLNEETQWMSPSPLERTISPPTTTTKKKKSAAASSSTLSPKKTATTARSKQSKELPGVELSKKESIEVEYEPLISTAELVASAKAAFDVSEKMISGSHIPSDEPIDSKAISGLVDSQGPPTSTDNHDTEVEGHILGEAIQKVDLENILERVKSETKDEKEKPSVVSQLDDESVKSKASVQSKTGSVISKVSKGSTKSVGSKNKVTTKSSSKGASRKASVMKSTTSPSSLSSRGSMSKAVTTSNNMTRRSNLAPPPSTSSSRDSNSRPPTISISRKAAIPSAKVKKTKTTTTATATASAVASKKIKDKR